MISIKKVNDETFEVTVDERTKTTHEVTLTEDYYQSLTQGKVTPEDLIKRSFEFLLERESNSSILRSFDLPVIGQYFPEYERTMKSTIGS